MENEEILHRCFRCGFCKLPGNFIDLNCPSYLKYRFETFSPGGRMWLMRAWLEGKLEPTKRFQEILFSCSACGNCVEQCVFPNFKDRLLLTITAGKEELVNIGKVPTSVRDSLTRLQSHGNPYGLPPKNRSDWVEGLDLDLFSDQEYLFYIGDMGSYDHRGQEIARSVTGWLKKQNVSFGILGTEERSDGNEAKAMGEVELFKYLADENIKTFNELKVKKIITLSPHGYHAFKNEYPQLGGQFEVFHYSHIIGSLLQKGPQDSSKSGVTVTVHDSCYLGRHNSDYGTVRNTLTTVPGLNMVEMDRSFQNSLCCGGGGGNVFTDIMGSGDGTAARARVLEAKAADAEILAVSCPGCAVMLEDALKAEKLENELKVMELSEIMTEYL